MEPPRINFRYTTPDPAMDSQTTTTTNSLFIDDDDRTQWLTLEQRLRYFEGSNLPGKPEHPRSRSGIQRLLQRLRRR